MPITTAILAKPGETALTARPTSKKTTGPSIPPHHVAQSFEETIRHQAYLKWEAAGMPEGDGVNFWLDAEREILHSTPSLS